jgi:predicted DsbA family dithiol-disulfide isomerase
MRIDIWSDVICPFCYIGKAELDRALEGRGDVDIVHHAFRLSPGAATEPVTPMLMRKYGLNAQQVAQNHAQLSERGAPLGIDFRFEDTLSGDTSAAHRLALAAQAHGIDLMPALYRAGFSQGRDLFDEAVLTELAVAAGMSAEAIREALSAPEWHAAMAADEQTAREMGIRGVPFFVFDNAVAVSGAQTAAALSQALDMAMAKSASVEGEVCGPDGCAV